MKKFFIWTFCFLMGLPMMAEEKSEKSELVNNLINRIHLSGYAQAGFNYYDQSKPKDQFKVARIIFMANAKVTDRINMFMMYDFNTGSLHELWANYSFCPELNVKAGQFKTPFSIENTMSPTVLELIYPGALATGYMIGGANPLMMKGGAGRDGGAMIYGSFLNNLISYDLGVMNGSGRNTSDNNSQKDFVARLSVNPVEWLTLSGSTIQGTGNIDVQTLSDGTVVSEVAPIDGLKHNGNFSRKRYAAGFQVKTAPVNLRSEYLAGKDGKTDSKGFYATGSVNNIGVKNLDLVASYDWLDNYAGKQNRYSGGLQYWFYPKCRLQLGYGYTTNSMKHDEQCILAQIQVRF